MDDAKSFVLGVFQTVKERFGNPLISAFVLSWLIWNFRLILVLVGDSDKDEGWRAKLDYFEKLGNSQYYWPVNSLLIPMGIALIWIYVLPPILRRVATHHERTSNRTREAMFAISDKRTLSADEALEMRTVMLKKHAEWLAEKAATVQSLENYEKTAEQLSQSLESARKTIVDLRKKIEELEKPVPRVKFDFEGKSLGSKAQHLGLKIAEYDPLVPPLVVFEGRAVVWPWMPTADHRFDLPDHPVFEQAITEEHMCAMLVLASTCNPGSLRARREWAHEVRAAGISRPDEMVQTLYLSRFLTGRTNEPEYPSMSAKVVSWLVNVGIRRAT